MDDIDRFLKEDLGEQGDITSNLLLKEEEGKAYIKANEKCVLAGVEEAIEVFNRLNCDAKALKKDGESVRCNEKII
ncbi:MAG: hypothetical protein QW762_03695 [Candidatus Thermoplasmatota archaeon]